jgi:hypothetical protein
MVAGPDIGRCGRQRGGACSRRVMGGAELRRRGRQSRRCPEVEQGHATSCGNQAHMVYTEMEYLTETSVESQGGGTGSKGVGFLFLFAA